MRPLITLLTDFGPGSGYPAQMKGVVLALCPEARLVDVSHEVAPYQILMGQVLLRDCARVFPAGTAHVAVVDPGVGTGRRGLVVEGSDRFARHLFVGPDNGLLWPFMTGGRVFELLEPAYRRPEVSPTFHGRDVFAPAAAHLALGVPPGRFGPEVVDPVRVSPPRVRHESGTVVGEVLFADRFGNLVSNLAGEDLPPADRASLRVCVGGRTIQGMRATYGQAAPGELVAVLGSSGLLEIAQREGSAARTLGLDEPRGMPVVVEL